MGGQKFSRGVNFLRGLYPSAYFGREMGNLVTEGFHSGRVGSILLSIGMGGTPSGGQLIT